MIHKYVCAFTSRRDGVAPYRNNRLRYNSIHVIIYSTWSKTILHYYYVIIFEPIYIEWARVPRDSETRDTTDGARRLTSVIYQNTVFTVQKNWELVSIISEATYTRTRKTHVYRKPSQAQSNVWERS